MGPSDHGKSACKKPASSGSNTSLKVSLADLARVTTLGLGAFGRVDLVYARKNQKQLFALKVMQKFPPDDQDRRRREINDEKSVWASASGSDFVVKLHATMQDADACYFLMEACLGGDLCQVLKDSGPVSNNDARFYTACVVEGLSYLHRQNIVHGDLKSCNIMLDARGYAKIIDFGFAEKLSPGSRSSSVRGTPQYMAPEIFLRHGHNTSADYWALGVLIFEMLTCDFLCKGVNYFDTDSKVVADKLINSISSRTYPCWMDTGAVDLIRALCRIMPWQRIGFRQGTDEIRKHKWFAELPWPDIQSRTFEPSFEPLDRPSGKLQNDDVAMKGLEGFYSGKPCQPKNSWPEF